MNPRALLIASAVSGLAIGILANISSVGPISFVNCLCCGWAWFFTLFSTWLYRQFAGEAPPLVPQRGALIGLTSGAIAVLVYGLNGLLSPLLFGGYQSLSSPADLLYLLPVAVVFLTIGLLGGFLGGSIFREKELQTHW